MRYDDVIDYQLELWEWWTGPYGRRYAEGFYDDIAKKGRAGGIDGVESAAPPAVRIAQMEASKMYYADPIWVSEEMMDLVEYATESFEPEALLRTDILTPHGFILLPRPLLIPDINGKMTATRALAWMPMTNVLGVGIEQANGIHLYCYTLNTDEDDYPITLDQAARSHLPRLTLLHSTPWPFDVGPGAMMEQDEKDDDTAWPILGNQWRITQGLFRLLMQYVSTREKQYASRPVRRRAAKAELVKDYVTVITLRRPRSKGNEGGTVEWSHRWVVDGHWRNQWYPSLEAHRQVWISPYVKGPEDKELHIRKGRFFKLVR